MMKRFFTGSILAAFLLLAPLASADATVSSFSPTSGAQGTTVALTITGQGMPTGGNVVITIGSTQLPFSVSARNDTQVTGLLAIPSSISVGSTTLNVSVNNDPYSSAFSVLAPVAAGSGTSGIPSDFLPPAPGTTPTTAGGLIGVIQTITNWIFGILLAVSVIFLVWAAFEFVTGGPDGAKSGKDKLLWAVIGIALALVAFGLPQIIRSIVVQQ